MRRYVLGRQGLWPGRRFAGKAGIAQAMRCAELIQVDPLNVVARSHDLALHSRVADYRPALLDELLYRDRAGFDYGEWLFIAPMAELPYWRPVMQRRAAAPRWATFAAAHGPLLDEVRQALRERGPLGSRDLAGGKRGDELPGKPRCGAGALLSVADGRADDSSPGRLRPRL